MARFYTVREAGALLPEVAELLAAMRTARDVLVDRQLLRALAEGAPQNGGGAAGRRWGEAFLRFAAAAARLRALDVTLRDLDRGLIDFRGRVAGREVCLCWLDGEPGLEWWHEVDAGFAGRRRIGEGEVGPE